MPFQEPKAESDSRRFSDNSLSLRAGVGVGGGHPVQFCPALGLLAKRRPNPHLANTWRGPVEFGCVRRGMACTVLSTSSGPLRGPSLMNLSYDGISDRDAQQVRTQLAGMK